MTHLPLASWRNATCSYLVPYFPPPLTTLTHCILFWQLTSHLTPTSRLLTVALVGKGAFRGGFCTQGRARLPSARVAIWGGPWRAVRALILAKLWVEILFPICLWEKRDSFCRLASGLTWLKGVEEQRRKQKGMGKDNRKKSRLQSDGVNQSLFGPIGLFL